MKQLQFVLISVYTFSLLSLSSLILAESLQQQFHLGRHDTWAFINKKPAGQQIQHTSKGNKGTCPVEVAMIARQFSDAWSISQELYDYIVSILPKGSTILELGSGWGTSELAKRYTMYSVENDQKWLNKYDTHYIYAPIVNGWYDTKVLKQQLPKQYDLILIDGPLAVIGRAKFFDNLALFNTNVPMIFDDVNRKPELDLLNKVAKYLGRPTKIFSGNGKQFGVILPQ